MRVQVNVLLNKNYVTFKIPPGGSSWPIELTKKKKNDFCVLTDIYMYEQLGLYSWCQSFALQLLQFLVSKPIPVNNVAFFNCHYLSFSRYWTDLKHLC